MRQKKDKRKIKHATTSISFNWLRKVSNNYLSQIIQVCMSVFCAWLSVTT